MLGNNFWVPDMFTDIDHIMYGLKKICTLIYLKINPIRVLSI